MPFKSEIALQAAAYEADAAKKKEWLKASIAAADAVEGASLGTSYGNIFNEKDPYSSEIIFAIYRDKANTNTDSHSTATECDSPIPIMITW